MKHIRAQINQDSDHNNFDFVRTVLATMVVFSHISSLTEIKSISWFNVVFSGDFAVKGFFAISGFLVMGSYVSSKSIRDFAEKRVRRIYPAYLSALILCLLIGLFTSSVNIWDFISSSQTVRYFLTNAAFLNWLQPTLPGVFASNPLPALDGSLWTIKIEVCLYCCIPFIFYSFRTVGNYVTSGLLICLSIVWVYFFERLFKSSAGAEIARQFPGQMSYFVIGALLCMDKSAYRHLKLVAAASALLYLLLRESRWEEVIEPFLYSTTVLFLSTQAIRNLNFGRFGDLSFGIYLYHFPIIQLLIWSGLFTYSLAAGIVATFAITIVLAFLSWHFIERKFLRRTSHYVVVAKI
jgi:peptidoglycan/LPS O-acetylase OafA/YrhL